MVFKKKHMLDSALFKETGKNMITAFKAMRFLLSERKKKHVFPW